MSETILTEKEADEVELFQINNLQEFIIDKQKIKFKSIRN